MTGAGGRPRLVLVLVRTAGAVNLGMIARLCANLGIGALRLVDPQCAPQGDEAIRYATSWGRELLQAASVHATLPAAIGDCALALGTSDARRDAGPPLTLEAARGLVTGLAGRPVALVCGPEADGLRAEELACCSAWVRLEHYGPCSAYNLAQAVAILGHALAAPPPRATAATGASGAAAPAAPGQRQLLAHRLALLLAQVRHPPALDPRFPRRLARWIGQLELDAGQVDAVQGMVASIARALPPAPERPAG